MIFLNDPTFIWYYKKNKAFSFKLILEAISEMYISCLWITTNFIVMHKLYFWVL